MHLPIAGRSNREVKQKTVLWWGRSDPEYARNRILRRCLVDAGFCVLDFRPKISAIGDLEARLHVRTPVDLVWVPCFRHRDVAAARRWADRKGLPLVFDPFISAYDKQVFERGKLAANKRRAWKLLRWEKQLFDLADVILADTNMHAEFFNRTLGVADARIHLVPLCADEDLFKPEPKVSVTSELVEVLFFGSFIPLQGPKVIVEAANRCPSPNIRWTLLGGGPLLKSCKREAAGNSRVAFEKWIPYETLPARIACADIVLGIFGDTPKAARVVPNKFCQALACARPVITRKSPVFPDGLVQSKDTGITWIPPADPEALCQAVVHLAASSQDLETLGHKALQSYKRYFSAARVSDSVRRVVNELLAGAAAQ